MKVISIDSLRGTDREVHCPHGGFVSFRALIASDGMGFSMHKTVIPAGETQRWHYKHHREACYCIEGKAMLRNTKTSEPFFIKPGTVYSLDKNDCHEFTAFEDTVLISVFNPPVVGDEVHDPDGSYPVSCGDPGDDPSRKEATQ